MADRITLQVARYRPEEQSAPTFQEYEVPVQKAWVFFDALNHVKDRIDGTLSFRWSCRMGVCGSCGMTVNEPKLTCATFLTDYAPGPVRVEPLRNLPVIRDLIVDLGDCMRKLVSVKPWLVRKEEKPISEGEYRQTPAELDAYKQFSMCINCMLCYSACPIYGLDPKFVGPAALALAALQPRLARSGLARAHGGTVHAWGRVGLRSSASAQGLPEERRSGRRDPALKNKARSTG
jgi:fumarate reductase iron-sulfur subunit